MRILLIEDNEMNAQIFMRMCVANGHGEIVHCDLGLPGLARAVQEQFDLIFIDFDLPDLNGLHIGLSLAWQMRRGHCAPNKLIALTAQSDHASQDEARKLGFHAFLGKPFTESDVMHLFDHFSRPERMTP